MSSGGTREERGDAAAAEQDPDHPQPASSETVQSESAEASPDGWCHVAVRLWKTGCTWMLTFLLGTSFPQSVSAQLVPLL